MIDQIKLVCFDLNKTLIHQNSWLDLNLAMGMTQEEDEMLFNLWSEGTLKYDEWMIILERIYKKRGMATKQKIQEIIFKYSYIEGAKEIVGYLQNKGYTICILSGAVTMLVEKVARELNIQIFEAGNDFIFNDQDYLEKIVTCGDEAQAKLENLQKICDRLNISMTNCVCVGDGDNEELIFKATGHGITFLNSKIEGVAWKVIESLEDIKEIF